MIGRACELAGAFSLLTRLPVGRLVPPALVAPRDCVWAYPLVGAAVGAIGAGAYWLARAVALPPTLGALWALAAMIVATGGFHEDGLADTADGFGGGASRARKLEIMRDSRIGTFGALALLLSLAIRAGAMVAIGDCGHVAAALVSAGALGRAAMLPPFLLLHPARVSGLGASVGAAALPRAAAALGVAAATTLILLPLPAAALALVAAAGASLCLAWLARAQIGGYTGDLLGAAEQVAECVVLTLLAQQFRVGGV